MKRALIISCIIFAGCGERAHVSSSERTRDGNVRGDNMVFNYKDSRASVVFDDIARALDLTPVVLQDLRDPITGKEYRLTISSGPGGSSVDILIAYFESVCGVSVTRDWSRGEVFVTGG